MPDIQKLFDSVMRVLALVFGSASRVPRALLVTIGIIGLVLLAIAVLYAVAELVGKLRKVWIGELLPIFYDAAERRRGRHRQMFARHIDREIWRLDAQEEWSDYRFARAGGGGRSGRTANVTIRARLAKTPRRPP